MGISQTHENFFSLSIQIEWLTISEPDRDKEDEIYITSASVIELDSRKCSDNDSYDSGIYNVSTNTGLKTFYTIYISPYLELSDEILYQIKFNLCKILRLFDQIGTISME